jgi:aminoglycoside phosphotransferase family enzyme/predicted kinase
MRSKPDQYSQYNSDISLIMANNNTSRLITQMQQPDFYPHAVVEDLKLVQTHASYVFLTGNYAYKVKKNVNYGFLDYSSLTKRKFFLDEELRLNRKIAPELYLEVLPISQHDSKFVLANSANIVEYALKMHAFPQENLFSNLLETDQLSGDYPSGTLKDSLRVALRDRLTELGKVVAKFHQNADTNEYISKFGTAANIRVAFAENYQQSQKYVGIQTREQLEATKVYTDYFFTEREYLLKQRVKQGKIKECHGDLHLNNICLWHNQIQLFDRIEFNESFRFVDTMYDIAFIVMDLEARKKPDLANIFLNSYLEYTGDWTGLLVLPLYLSRQAYVRAKVNSFLLDDTQVSEDKKQQAKKSASQYYQLAYQYTQTQSGSLILMSGLSGSGKSTVARTIAQNKGAIHIRSDAVRKHLAGIPVDQSASDRLYTAAMTQKTYDRLLELGLILVQEGYTVILDAKYDRLSLRQPVITQAKEQNILLKIIYCTAPESVLRDRLNQRQNDISDATADLISTQQAKAEDFSSQEQNYVTTIDTAQANWSEKLSNIYSRTKLAEDN